MSDIAHPAQCAEIDTPGAGDRQAGNPSITSLTLPGTPKWCVTVGESPGRSR